MAGRATTPVGAALRRAEDCLGICRARLDEAQAILAEHLIKYVIRRFGKPGRCFAFESPASPLAALRVTAARPVSSVAVHQRRRCIRGTSHARGQAANGQSRSS